MDVKLDGRDIVVKFKAATAQKPGPSLHTVRTTLTVGRHTWASFPTQQGAVPGNGIDLL